MTLRGIAGYESTFAHSIDLPRSGEVWYYVRASTGAQQATQSPVNTADVWPPPDNLLALAARDTTGDARNPEGPFLDLTGLWVGWSAEYFYAKLTNNHTSWPLSAGPFGPWFLYSVGFANPEAKSDSWVFSLSYANVPLAFSTGLYLINRYTGNYSKLADIEVITSGNCLHLRGRRSDIELHPRFAPWPNSSGATAVAANTQTIRVSGATPRDTTLATYFYPLRTPSVIIARNRPPVLGDARVIPRSGNSETPFRFSCFYTDPDSHLPTRFQLFVEADSFELRPAHHRYWAGCQFLAERAGFTPGWKKFIFSFSDGMASVQTSPDSFFVSSVGVAESETETIPKRLGASVATKLLTALSLTAGHKETYLLDCTGRRLASLRADQNQVNFLPVGVYFLIPASERPLCRLVVLP